MNTDPAQTSPAPLRLIAGSGRSGTTWVLDSLAGANGFRPMFEPFNPYTCGEIAQRYAHRYLTRRDHCADLRDYLAQAASGTLGTAWTDYRIIKQRLRPTFENMRSLKEFRRLANAWRTAARQYEQFRPLMGHEQTLVKCVRLNLMLDWVHAEFDARILLLVRHPCAVVESQLRYERAWEPHGLLRRYLNDPALVAGPLSPFVDFLRGITDRTTALGAAWAIQNAIPLRQAAENGYQVVFYEEALEQPEREWRKMLDALELDVAPNPSLLRKPSQQATRDVGAGGYSHSYSKWRESLSQKDIRAIQLVLDEFDIEWYNVHSDRPVSTAAALATHAR